MRRRLGAIVVATFFACGTACRAGTIVSSSQGVEVIVSSPDEPRVVPRKHAAIHVLSHASAAATGEPMPLQPLPVAPLPVFPTSGVRDPTAAQRLLQVALAYVGVRYLWGGASPSGFDCSGYTWFAFARLGIVIPRTADLQFEAGRPVAGQPLPGDLVFFQTYDYGASHVGIYLGSGQFINSIGTDVHVASFATPYFRDRYLGARRFLPG